MEPDLDLDRLGDRDLLLGDLDLLLDLERDLLGDLDLRRDLDLLDLSLDLLRGLPVRERVLARESGDPDLDLVLGLPPESDLERLLPLSGDPGALTTSSPALSVSSSILAGDLAAGLTDLEAMLQTTTIKTKV